MLHVSSMNYRELACSLVRVGRLFRSTLVRVFAGVRVFGEHLLKSSKSFSK